MRSSHSLLACCLLLSCFEPDLAKLTILCTNNQPGQCPDGQQCLQGICGVADNLADAGVDSSTSPPDLAPIPGCKTAVAVSIPDQATCNAVAGFFVADQPAYWMGTMSQETCGTAISNQLLYGCGAAGRAGNKLCGGLTRVLDLGAGWTSSNGTLTNAANTQASQGVLCCKAGGKAVGCAGTFTMGQASSQCAAGWAPCTTLP